MPATVQQPYQEYDKQVRSAEQVGALTSDLFGDAVNVYDQSASFQQTDIDLRGTNALPVRLSRKLSVRPIPTRGMPPQIYGGAGDWNVDVPFISGVFDSHYGWILRGWVRARPRVARIRSIRGLRLPTTSTASGPAIRSTFLATRRAR